MVRHGVTQSAETNAAPRFHMRVGPLLNLILKMDMSADMTGAPAPMMDSGCPLCLRYHLKGVCKLNSRRQNSHRPLSNRENGVLDYLKGWLYGNSPLSVAEVERGYLSQKNLCSFSHRTWGGRGGREGRGKDQNTPSDWRYDTVEIGDQGTVEMELEGIKSFGN